MPKTLIIVLLLLCIHFNYAKVSEETKETYRTEFGNMDKDRDGSLDFDEVIEGFGYSSIGVDRGEQEDMATTIMYKLDVNQDGKVDLEEFMQIVNDLMDPDQQEQEEEFVPEFEDDLEKQVYEELVAEYKRQESQSDDL